MYFKILYTHYIYYCIHIFICTYIGIVIHICNRTLLPIELICNVTGFATWRVDFNNGTNGEFTPNGLLNNNLNGHGVNGNNILINVPMNNTKYVCVSNEGLSATLNNPTFLYIAGKHAYMHVCMYVLRV